MGQIRQTHVAQNRGKRAKPFSYGDSRIKHPYEISISSFGCEEGINESNVVQNRAKAAAVEKRAKRNKSQLNQFCDCFHWQSQRFIHAEDKRRNFLATEKTVDILMFWGPSGA